MSSEWANLNELQTILNCTAPYSYHCFAFWFPGDNGFTACISVVERGRVVRVAHGSETYPTAQQALAVAYHSAVISKNEPLRKAIAKNVITSYAMVKLPDFSEE